MISRKKLYQEFINNVVCDVSISSHWRKKLFGSPPDTRFRLDAESLANTNVLQKEILETHQLIYYVWKGDLEYSMVRFWFASAEYPEITNSSWNNPASI
jgi:hypothetical protein